MNIHLLRATNLRCFEQVSFAPGPGINWLIGRNGAGKTTLLEAAYILSHGRSFRPGGRDAPRRDGTHDYLIYAELTRKGRAKVRLGLARSQDRWMARENGEELPNLAPLFEACPVVYFGPESQGLVLGPAELRRSFLDWAVFHVEHASLTLWRAWRRGLRQRNALLRQNATAADFVPWEDDLAVGAARIHGLRARCLDALEPYLAQEAAILVPELGALHVAYRPGWDTGMGLRDQLARTRDRDRERGFTGHGPHRADWSLRFDRVAERTHLSRGQAKSVALVCTLALTRWLGGALGEYPLLCLDDLESELDASHANLVIEWLGEMPIQSWLTRTEPIGSGTRIGGSTVFHVEHRACTRVDPSPAGNGQDHAV